MASIDNQFGDLSWLAHDLFEALGEPGTDGSHDRSHLLRVWRNAEAIARHEPSCDRTVLVSAVLLHDCVPVEKNSPERPLASRLSAARARTILTGLGLDTDQVDAAGHAIEAHSFSAGIAPRTLEARILQDADRLDAIGAIGIARCFYIAGRMGSGLYDPDDPAAQRRPLNDMAFALDHFEAKLLRLADNFQTQSGQALAHGRTLTMANFLSTFANEIGGEAE